jgi:hypothetical protein
MTPRATGIAVAAVIALAVVAIGVYGWMSLADSEMTVNGYIALALGALGTVALGGGLMALVFYSHRRGYDDDVGGASRDRKRE